MVGYGKKKGSGEIFFKEKLSCRHKRSSQKKKTLPSSPRLINKTNLRCHKEHSGGGSPRTNGQPPSGKASSGVTSLLTGITEELKANPWKVTSSWERILYGYVKKSLGKKSEINRQKATWEPERFWLETLGVRRGVCRAHFTPVWGFHPNQKRPISMVGVWLQL